MHAYMYTSNRQPRTSCQQVFSSLARFAQLPLGRLLTPHTRQRKREEEETAKQLAAFVDDHQGWCAGDWVTCRQS